MLGNVSEVGAHRQHLSETVHAAGGAGLGAQAGEGSEKPVGEFGKIGRAPIAQIPEVHLTHQHRQGRVRVGSA